jgi:hypothetical protein
MKCYIPVLENEVAELTKRLIIWRRFSELIKSTQQTYHKEDIQTLCDLGEI